jgi:hypothetical protein
MVALTPLGAGAIGDLGRAEVGERNGRPQGSRGLIRSASLNHVDVHGSAHVPLATMVNPGHDIQQIVSLD